MRKTRKIFHSSLSNSFLSHGRTLLPFRLFFSCAIIPKWVFREELSYLTEKGKSGLGLGGARDGGGFCEVKLSYLWIRHLFLLYFLDKDVEELLDVGEDEDPFGKGLWPCLNKDANHYKQLVIKNVIIIRDFK
ncbi:TnsD family Tn7-like transposition protein [Bacillus atrophaeus]|uniref:TnsD family Tn7-like transposition protein n=1 Tax=Bacillus atrophaeus TaxID=1452 RepID=UPI0018F21814|nr:TnsD family Tn7-like transposition protein [Bacillus atrophaeus]MEC1903504.1 TnsD family Tn7-like transposition protein [Bacillus atrophaeus]MEC2399237.1 TnsD family Tn7-like transposition protein [Bacillus atrophaeus]MED4437606.1 TnsD family Tn7-like transposition protein [Bacillus atrophaeus]MED4575806.1 TnsD family Tn7-like transposition protein [Bacillus atrophaeus]MED4776741.1 TnsD family Tn7-like transposition protein [Bacillus atrophaeus]